MLWKVYVKRRKEFCLKDYDRFNYIWNLGGELERSLEIRLVGGV